MPATILTGETLNNHVVKDMLPYDKNCVAMAFSRVLGIGVYATLNHFVSKQWISRASDLENINKLDKVLKGLGLKACYDDKTWSIETGMKGQGDGRYFAVNWGVNGKTGSDPKGHAFAIVKKGGIGIAGNNAEATSRPYHGEIMDHKISVFGPIA
ncbi:MAG TPA: hypothetical protein VGR37_22620 [Longimicrobiaceae bacterium]|nr:hypothetical protein [Longimicrobiaceae bacterium]